MYTDKLETVEFITEYFVIDQVIDWFGMDVKIEKAGDKYKVTVRVSPQAMEYWAMQYLNTVEIISPLSLREKLKENLKKATEKYNQ
jgi:predicted DNA-binding transcriptional regulator YafY